MMLDIARRAINASSYEELQQTYFLDWNIKISDDQIRLVTNHIGKLVYDNDCAERDAALDHFENNKSSRKESVSIDPADVLYVEMDGAMFNTRKQENSSTWRENKLGLVFSSKDLLIYKNKKGEEIRRIGKREYISYVGTAEEFQKFLYFIALRNGLETHNKIVIISDGAKWIKNFKETYCIGMNVTHILDFSHLKENTYKFSNAFVRGKNAKTAWAEKVLDLIRDGKVAEAMTLIEPYKDKRQPGIPNLYSYLQNNIECIDYPSYKKAGYFIGSGAIESGNKSTMQERLKLPGMRWDVENAQYILSAKMKYDSKLWDSKVVPLVYDALSKTPSATVYP